MFYLKYIIIYFRDRFGLHEEYIYPTFLMLKILSYILILIRGGIFIYFIISIKCILIKSTEPNLSLVISVYQKSVKYHFFTEIVALAGNKYQISAWFVYLHFSDFCFIAQMPQIQLI